MTDIDLSALAAARDGSQPRVLPARLDHSGESATVGSNRDASVRVVVVSTRGAPRALQTGAENALLRSPLIRRHDGESTGIPRFSPELRDSQIRCLAVENEQQPELSKPTVW